LRKRRGILHVFFPHLKKFLLILFLIALKNFSSPLPHSSEERKRRGMRKRKEDEEVTTLVESVMCRTLLKKCYRKMRIYTKLIPIFDNMSYNCLNFLANFTQFSLGAHILISSNFH